MFLRSAIRRLKFWAIDCFQRLHRLQPHVLFSCSDPNSLAQKVCDEVALVLKNQCVDEVRVDVQVVMHDAVAQAHNGSPHLELFLREAALQVQALKRVVSRDRHRLLHRL